jgi:aryl-alcohol dehydrogenase-like predicted oxidoreductase
MLKARELGRTGLKVFPLGFGGAEIGFEAHDGPDAVRRLLHDAIDRGLNVVDTAQAYLESEALIGQALVGRRQDVLLFTKCGAVDGFSRSDWSKAGILNQLKASLKALRTDYVDLLQLHSCSQSVLAQGECIQALQDARQAGLVRFIGYSGDGAHARYALELDVFDTLQTSLSIADQEPIQLTLPLAVEKGVGVIAKRPIANAAWRYRTPPENGYHQDYYQRLQALKYPFLADPDQAFATALKFTLSQPQVAVAIVGTTKPERFRRNLELAGDGVLATETLDAIRARFQAVADQSWVGLT